MSKPSFGPADEPFNCDRLHVIWRTKKQRIRRFKKVAKWGREGLPAKMPNWIEWTKNHSGGGGP